jgi:glycosyltransferase involved in cell wall biosynthesis
MRRGTRVLNREPAVTVVIPVQDRIEYLGAALASVREQTFSDIEVLVIDAGSVQPIGELVRAVGSSDERFRVLRSDERLGSAAARNRGIAAARGALIAHLDSDDLMSPTRLERQVEAFEGNDNLVCVAGRMRVVDVIGLPQPSSDSSSSDGALSDAQVRWSFPFEMPSLSSTLTMRAGALRRIGGFDLVHSTCDDYGTMRGLLELGRVIRLSQVVVDYRRHHGQISTSRAIEQKAQLALLRRDIVSERLGRRVGLGPVLALNGGSVADTSHIDEAESLCDELLAVFLATVRPSDTEIAWVRADHAKRRERISALRQPRDAAVDDEQSVDVESLLG